MQAKLDTSSPNFGLRLRAFVEGRGAVEEAYGRIGVSRATLFNWFQRKKPPPGKEKLDKLRRYLDGDAEWVLFGRAPAQHLKIGHRGILIHEAGAGKSRTVASRIPERRAPSTRQDCEQYFQLYLDAAERDGDPDNFPEIMRRLRRHFKLDDWEEPPTSEEK